MSLAWSGGKYLAVGQSTGEILLWDWKTGSPYRKLLGHTGAVYNLAFYDNANLISGSVDTTIKIWNIYDGSTKQTIKDHSDAVLSMAILQNGYFGTGSNNGVILIHSFFVKPSPKITKPSASLAKSVYRKKAVYTISTKDIQINCFVSLGNGFLASGSADKLIRIWNLEAKSFIGSLKGHSADITSLVVLENGDLVSASLDKTILVWSLSNGTILKNISNHESAIISLALLKNGQLAVGLANGKISIRSTDLDTVVTTLSAHAGPVSTLLEIKINDAEFLATASSKEAKVYVWDIKTGSKKLISMKANVRSLAQLKDERLAVGTEENEIAIIDLNDPSNTEIELAGHSGAVSALAVLENGVLVSSSADKTVLLWKKKTSNSRFERILKFPHHVSALIALNTGAFQFALSDTENKELVLYEIEFVENDSGDKEQSLDAKSELIQKIEAHIDRVSAIVLLEGEYLVSASLDGSIRITNKDYSVKKYINSYMFKITSLAALKNGFFAAGYSDGLVIVWNKEGNEVRRLREHTNLITSMSLLSNGFLATCSVDGKIILWNWNEGSIVRTLHDDKAAVTSIVELENDFIATGYANNSLMIWDSNGLLIR